MPYLVELPAHSPYIPDGLRELDRVPKELREPVKIGDVWFASKLGGGAHIDPALMPRRFAVGVDAEELPGLFSLRRGFGVRVRFREKVEELEPGVHQFFPVELSDKGGNQVEGHFWLLHVRNMLNAIDPERTTLARRPDSRRYSAEGYRIGDPIGLVLREAVVAGKSIWRDQNITGTFCSDELYEFVEKNEITKLNASKVQAV